MAWTYQGKGHGSLTSGYLTQAKATAGHVPAYVWERLMHVPNARSAVEEWRADMKSTRGTIIDSTLECPVKKETVHNPV